MKDKREPRGVCRFVWQRQGTRISLKYLDGRCPRDLIAHRGRRLDCEDAEVEPVAEGSGERTGPRADVHESHSLRRAQVTSYRLAPLQESVAWDLADRLVGRGGLLVIADPGHVMPLCWCLPRAYVNNVRGPIFEAKSRSLCAGRKPYHGGLGGRGGDGGGGVSVGAPWSGCPCPLNRLLTLGGVRPARYGPAMPGSARPT